MDTVLATKTHAEREDEETERLIRPAPKVKPSRHDRKREQVQVVDPDLETKDPDLSLNYKGVTARVVTRWLAQR